MYVIEVPMRLTPVHIHVSEGFDLMGGNRGNFRRETVTTNPAHEVRDFSFIPGGKI